MFVRGYMTEHDRVWKMHSIELKFGMYDIAHRPTNCVDFGKLRINSSFYRSTKNNSYALQPMESNYKKYAGV